MMRVMLEVEPQPMQAERPATMNARKPAFEDSWPYREDGTRSR
jgi:hypothetical protein